ncbi:MAG: ATP synthase F1 subunit delta [Halanaerobiales bacterium]
MEDVSKAAKKYGQALFAVAKENGKIDVFQKELKQILDLIKGNKEFRQVLYHKRILPQEKKKVIKEIFTDNSRLILNFLFLIIDKHREDYLEGIIDVFNNLVKKEKQLIEVEVISAVEINKEDRKNLHKKLDQMLPGTIKIKNKKDPGIIGGLILKIGDYVIDGSIKNQLNLLQKRIEEIPVKELGV